MEAEYRSGQDRFYDRYPDYPRQEEYLGVGAMMIPVGLEAEVNNGKTSNNIY